jgi:putative FmdB family regulatory protein
MPIYEYQCESCESVFEKLTFKSDTEDIVCPCCCSKKTKKVLSAASFLSGSSGLGSCSPNTSSGFS